MKKRIISLILVVVMLALTLTGCAYRYENDDLSKYATFNKETFEAELAAGLTIADGEFTKEARAKLLNDKLLDILSGKLDNSSTKIKKTSGKLDGNDIVYYCMYYTMVDDNGVVRYFSTSLMKPESAAKLHFGYSTNAAEKLLFEEKLKDYELEGNVYDAVTTGDKDTATNTDKNSVNGAKAFISYTVEYKKDGKAVKETHEYELVTLGDENHFVAKKLVGATVGEKQNKLEEGSGDNLKTYTNATINVVVKNDKPIVITDTTYTTEKKNVADNIKEDGTDVKYDLTNKPLTYYIYPVYGVDIPELDATTLMDTLYSSLEAADLECLKEKTEDLEALEKLVTEEATAKTAYDKAKTELDTAKKNYDTAVKNLEDKKAGVTQETVDELKRKLEEKQKAFNGEADDKGNLKAEPAYEAAKKATKEKRETIINEVGAAKIVDEFKKYQHAILLDGYNREIKDNLAKAIYDLIIKNTVVVDKDSLPRKAIQQAYDSRINTYKHQFYELNFKEASSSTSNDAISNYTQYGSFEKYLSKAIAKTENFADAKHYVWAEAVKDVSELIVIYNAAQVYDVKLDKKDIEEYKENFDVNQDHYWNYYWNAYQYSNDSVENVLRTSVQFDKLMNLFLVHEEVDNADGGKDFKYTYGEGLKFKITGEKE